jgi:hypothetical protein
MAVSSRVQVPPVDSTLEPAPDVAVGSGMSYTGRGYRVSLSGRTWRQTICLLIRCRRRCCGADVYCCATW